MGYDYYLIYCWSIILKRGGFLSGVPDWQELKSSNLSLKTVSLSFMQVVHHRYVSNQSWYKPSGEINKTSNTHTWVTASPGSITDLDDNFVMHAHTKPRKWTCCEDKHLLQVMLCNKSAPDKVTLWINPLSESLRKKNANKKVYTKMIFIKKP